MKQKMHLRAVKSFNLVFRERFNLSQKFKQPVRSLALFYFLFSNILIIFSY
ncbi:hypothetical protein ABE143_14645 [Bacillus subtilis]